MTIFKPTIWAALVLASISAAIAAEWAFPVMTWLGGVWLFVAWITITTAIAMPSSIACALDAAEEAAK